ncbi:MAG: LAGLIDADG family homing endonuclease [Patescibacteria group bacterium]
MKTEQVEFKISYWPKQLAACRAADTHKYTLFGGSRGPGKALDINTELPTPDGWLPLWALRVGDKVIGRDGLPCTVTWCSPVWNNRSCYRLTFDDGAVVVADAEHEWLVFSKDDRVNLKHRTEEWRAARRIRRTKRGKGKKPWLAIRNAERAKVNTIFLQPPTGRIVTTDYISKTLTVQNGREVNWSIPLCKPFDCQEAELPVDPYVLGVWLGDGSKCGGSFTTADQGVLDQIHAHGFETTKWRSAKYAYNITGFKTMLRRVGLLNNKRIPRVYMRSSLQQRLELIRGLMDTDGFCDRDGYAEFNNTNRSLAQDMLELLRSVGLKAASSEGRAKLYGKDCGPTWTIRASGPVPLFTLPRKLNRQKLSGFNGINSFRYIVKCESAPSIPVACIEVDSPDHLYLCTRNWIPTHNSRWIRWYLLEYLLRCRAEGLNGVHVGLFCEDYVSLTDRQISKITTEFPRSLGEVRKSTTEGLGFHFHDGNGFLALRNLDDPSRYQSAEFAVIGVDELTKNPLSTFNILRGSLRWPGIKEPRFVATANPGGIGHVWCKSYWIDRAFPPELQSEAGQFVFVPALPSDNPSLPKSYWDMLNTLPEPLRLAWVEGRWDVFTEQAFAFNPNIHVLPKPLPVPANAPLYMTFDYGFSKPYSTGWWWVDADKRLYRFTELYGAMPGGMDIGLRQSDDEIAERIVAHEKREGLGGVKITRLCDPTCFNKKPDTRGGGQGPSTAEVFARAGLRMIPGDASRVLKFRQLHQRLRVIPGQLPMLVVYPCCVDFIRTIQLMQVNPHDPEEIDTRLEDHPVDEACHVVMARPMGIVVGGESRAKLGTLEDCGR